MAAVLALWRRAEASPSSTESAADLMRLLERDGEPLLVAAVEERLRALGARRLNAIVETEEADAMGFWAAAGYELQGARSRFVKTRP